MSSEDCANPVESDATTTITRTGADVLAPPYSIFDNRQKWFIIIIVSTAATCECTIANVVYLAC
jgi:hypothetical protein